MVVIIDKSKTKNSKSIDSRKKFMDRYEHIIRNAVHKISEDTNISDILDSKEIKLKLASRDLEEHAPAYARYTIGLTKRIAVSTTKVPVGTVIGRETYPKDSASGHGTGNGEGESGEQQDEYEFKISLEEFLEIYFQGLALPFLLKKSLRDSFSFKPVNGGFTKDGIMPRLSIRKTFEAAIARRVASKSSGKKPPYLDDIDLRYRNFVMERRPITHAVIFFIMDCSGSMQERQKTLAKKFYTLFTLFLTSQYKKVDIEFIRYHHEVSVCETEKEFFERRDTGGTEVIPALRAAKDIIQTKYPADVNVYIAHTTDGGCGYEETADSIAKFMQDELQPLIQYYAMVGISNFSNESMIREVRAFIAQITRFFKQDKHVGTALISSTTGIEAALRKLFDKGNQ